ncbi:MAG TPA: response regulator transcription factor [Candidatus Acidoferrales bacterium]|nr:response regulator transcription factor [Candidatus Acidoferrales bacterium]
MALMTPLVAAHQIRAVVIETQSLFADALCHVLSGDPDFQVTSVIKSTDELPIHCMENVDLVLLDIDDYCANVDQAVFLCAQRFPNAKLCVLSSFAHADVMQRCLAAHASGYIVKDTSLSELASALKAIASGTPYVDPRVAGAILRRRALNHEAAIDELSGRETEIVRLIAQGLSNRDIGSRLLLSEKTVKNHISRIFDKLHITARTQAAVYAIRTGIA